MALQTVRRGTGYMAKHRRNYKTRMNLVTEVGCMCCCWSFAVLNVQVVRSEYRLTVLFSELMLLESQNDARATYPSV